MRRNSILKSIILYAGIIIFMLSLFSIVDNLLVYRARRLVEVGRVWDGVEQYGKLTSLMPDSSLADDALYEAGEALWEFRMNDEMQFSMVSTEKTIESMMPQDRLNLDTALSCWLTLIRKYPGSSLIKNADVRVAEVYYSLGLWDDVIDTIDDSLEQYGKYWDRAAYLKAGAYLKKGRPEKALTLIDGIEKDLTCWLEIMKGDALVGMGEFNLAGRVYAGINTDSFAGGSSIVEQRMLRLKCMSEGTRETVFPLMGRVTAGGNGMPGVRVEAVNRYIDGESYATYTNKDGVYRFETIPEGVYIIKAQIPSEAIQGRFLEVNSPPYITVDGKSNDNVDFFLNDRLEAKLYREGHVVSIEWQDYPGASSYRVYAGEIIYKGGSGRAANPSYLNVMGSTVVKQQLDQDKGYTAYFVAVADVKENRYVMDAAEENGRYFSDMIGRASAVPGFVLGIPYYGGEIAFKIQVLDEKGRAISESNECPTAFLHEDMGNVYDMISNQRYEGAKDLLENADSTGDMEMLARLYQATFRFRDSAETYYRLYEKGPDDTHLKKAVDMWERAGEYQQAIDALERAPSMVRNSIKDRMAILYLWNGEREKSGELFDSMQEKSIASREHVIYHMLREEYDEAMKVKHPPELEYIGYVIEKGISEMKACISGEALAAFKQCIQRLDNPGENNLQGFIVEYRSFRDTYRDKYPHMESLLLELGRTYWDI